MKPSVHYVKEMADLLQMPQVQHHCAEPDSDV